MMQADLSSDVSMLATSIPLHIMGNVSPLPVAVAISAHLGIPIFPCKAGSKKPYTAHGFKDATLDPDQIVEWWQKWPDALVGMPTGKASGYVILDVDVKNDIDGAASLHNLEQQHGKLPDTWQVITPSGGFHYWLKNPDIEVKNSQSRIGDGLDIRGNGGYVVIPPSKNYEWEASNPNEPAEMPAWLIELNSRSRDKKSINKASKKENLIQDIKRKGNSFFQRLPSVSQLHNFPIGEYQAEFIGWTVLEPKAFILKKGKVRIEMRFKVFIPSGYRLIGGFHTVDVRQAPMFKGQISAGRSSQLAKDLGQVIGGIDQDGFPIQLNLDDVNLDVFTGKRLQVTVSLTKKSYAIVTAISLPH